MHFCKPLECREFRKAHWRISIQDDHTEIDSTTPHPPSQGFSDYPLPPKSQAQTTRRYDLASASDFLLPALRTEEYFCVREKKS